MPTSLQPDHIVVAGGGTIWVAPENTAMPTDLADLATPWADVGYVSEDGATFTFSREQEDVNAWQAAEPVRVLVTQEPKTIEFDLLEWDRTSVQLAFRGGTWVGSASPYTYTPPDAGATDVRAMVVDAIDGTHKLRFGFPRVQLTGDLDWQFVRTDAAKLGMEFSVLAAATKWVLLGDLVGFAAGAGALAADLEGMTRSELDAYAASIGVDTTGAATKADAITQIQEATGTPAAA